MDTKRSSSRGRLLGGVVVLMLAGCMTPGPAIPKREILPMPAPETASPSVTWPASRWWSDWGPPELSGLIDRALAGSPSMAIVQARLDQARFAVASASAAGSPRLNLGADLLDTRFSENGLVPASLAGRTVWSSSVLFNGSWELDLFDRQRHLVDAAVGELRASQADAQAAQVLLATQVAASYVGLARLIELRALSTQSVSQFDQALALVSQRVAAGLDTQVEQRQAQTAAAQARAEQLAVDELILRQRHALAELTGQRPDALDALTPALFSVTGLGLPDELPADLVGRRADLVAQRWRVESALSGIEVKRSDFYPSVNLIGFVGLSSLGLDRLIDLGSRTHGVGPAFRLPIFDGGALQSRLSASEAGANAAIEAYNATLLKALREVRDEVVSIRSIHDQSRAQSDALKAAQAAQSLAIERYRAGLGNYLTVLTVQNALITQQRAMTELRARALSSELMLVRALGGGFQEEPESRPRAQAAQAAALGLASSSPKAPMR